MIELWSIFVPAFMLWMYLRQRDKDAKFKSEFYYEMLKYCSDVYDAVNDLQQREIKRMDKENKSNILELKKRD